MTTTNSPAPVSSLRTKIEIAAAIAALIFGFIAWRTMRAEHAARVKAETTAAAAQKDFQSAQTQIGQLQRQDAAAKAAADQKIAAIRASAAKANTPQDVARFLSAQAALPTPAVVAPSSAGSPPQIEIPAPDLAPLKDFVAEATTCAVELPEAQSGLSSCQAQAKLAQQQLADVEKERDAYKTALKGGTFWHRISSGAKKVAIGAAIGAAAMCASGHCK